MNNIYDGLDALFGGSLVTEVSDFLGILLEILNDIFSASGAVSTAMTITMAIGATLMILYFYVEVTSMASKDMLTLEKLMTLFIKLLVAFCVMIYLPEIISTLFSFGYNLFYLLKQSVSTTGSNITFFGKSYWPEFTESLSGQTYDGKEYGTLQEGFEKVFKFKIGDAGNWIGIFFKCTLLQMGGLVTKVAAYFVTVTSSLNLITRGMLSPIGVAQLFSDGAKSEGIRYLKKFAASCVSFAVLVGMLWACSALQAGFATQFDVLNGETAITFDNIRNVITRMSWGQIIPCLVIRFAALGGIMKGNQIANDIFGV